MAGCLYSLQSRASSCPLQRSVTVLVKTQTKGVHPVRHVLFFSSNALKLTFHIFFKALPDADENLSLLFPTNFLLMLPSPFSFCWFG